MHRRNLIIQIQHKHLKKKKKSFLPILFFNKSAELLTIFRYIGILPTHN